MVGKKSQMGVGTGEVLHKERELGEELGEEWQEKLEDNC